MEQDLFSCYANNSAAFTSFRIEPGNFQYCMGKKVCAARFWKKRHPSSSVNLPRTIGTFFCFMCGWSRPPLFWLFSKQQISMADVDVKSYTSLHMVICYYSPDFLPENPVNVTSYRANVIGFYSIDCKSKI